MADSFFTARKDSVLAAGSQHFSTLISATPTAYGLVAAQATAFATLNTAWQTAYAAASNPGTRTKSLVAAKDAAREQMRASASNLAKIISGTPSVTDAQRIDLGIAVRAIPQPMPAPGTSYDFKATVDVTGAVTLVWKCDNPKRASGTIYQVFRRIGTAGEFTYLGGTGERKITDSSIPAGATQLTYRVQAVRSTAAGAWAEFNVNFGASANGLITTDAATVKLAA